jgi:hypothetical protein
VRGPKKLTRLPGGFLFGIRGKTPPRRSSADSKPCSAVQCRGCAKKAVFKLTREFHTARHTLYSADKNMEIEKVVSVAAGVKPKLGKGGSAED